MESFMQKITEVNLNADKLTSTIFVNCKLYTSIRIMAERLRAQVMSGLISDLTICEHRKRIWSYITLNVPPETRRH